MKSTETDLRVMHGDALSSSTTPAGHPPTPHEKARYSGLSRWNSICLLRPHLKEGLKSKLITGWVPKPIRVDACRAHTKNAPLQKNAILCLYDMSCYRESIESFSLNNWIYIIIKNEGRSRGERTDTRDVTCLCDPPPLTPDIQQRTMYGMHGVPLQVITTQVHPPSRFPSHPYSTENTACSNYNSEFTA